MPVERTATDAALIALKGASGAALAGARYALGGAPGVPTGGRSRTTGCRGLILGGVHAPTSLAGAWALWRRHPRATEVALGAGAVPLGWIAAQVAIIGPRSFLEPLMLGVGLVDLALGWRRR